MQEQSSDLNKLIDRLNLLSNQQEAFVKEINELKDEIVKLKISGTISASKKFETPKNEEITTPVSIKIEKTEAVIEKPQAILTSKKSAPGSNIKNDIEKFIGENLINKIGILITIFGVGIGSKYAIENELISPLTRIVIGYLFGLIMLGTAMKLKQNFKSFSAVLLSGAMAILYFITFAAYSFYGLIPQLPAFVIMLIFTAFTVYAALKYDMQIIAHIGLVGAYAVPFLLSDGSGKVLVLFSYVAIINVGILAISFKKYWKSLFYSSFIITWLIFASWFFLDYKPASHYIIAPSFLIINFLTFYINFLAYKFVKNELFAKNEIPLIILNSFIFYGIGYSILEQSITSNPFLGLFTVGNALIHFIVCVIIYQKKLADKNLFYLISGLVLVFITIAIPVQLSGNWVTLLWIGEAALVFWIGRTKKIAIYENLAYPLMLLSFFSLIYDWNISYKSIYAGDQLPKIPLFLNIYFLTSIVFIVAWTFITRLFFNQKFPPFINIKNGGNQILSFLIPLVLLFTCYYAIRIEIETYWDQLYLDSSLRIPASENDEYSNYYINYDLLKFKNIWVINYSLMFFSILTWLNIRFIKNQKLNYFNLAFIIIGVAAFLGEGLINLGQLSASYLNQDSNSYFESSSFNIYFRYISYTFVCIAAIAGYQNVKQPEFDKKMKIIFDFLLHITIIWILSIELTNWMEMAQIKQSYKLGLSIFWGIYALFLISYGIWKKKKHIRIGAIVLFSFTLLKLFLYDITHLDTIAKTLVFVSLGILLLVISFLYNKYKNIISNEMDKE